MRYLLCLTTIVALLSVGNTIAQAPDIGALPMTFHDEAAARNVLEPGYGRGAAMVDLDGDGLLDLIVVMSEMEDAFLRQKPDGTFEKMNTQWGIPTTLDRGWGVLAADFDGDGDRDVYFPTGGFTGAQANVFLRNDLDTIGIFSHVTASSGDAPLAATSNFGGTALDYDLDGDLDIFVTTTDTSSLGNSPVRCYLLRNDGGLVFTDVSSSAGITHLGDFRHCSTGDYDNDGYNDIVVGNFDGPNLLYHNNGDGTFSEVAAAAGVADPIKNFGAVFEDFDNDGWLDIYGAKYQFGSGGPSGLFLNNQDGTFRDVRLGSRMTRQGDMGHNCGDLNADGFPDIFIGTGHPNVKRMDSVKFVRPDGGGGLMTLEVGEMAGFLVNGPTRAHGSAFGDINRDGYQDIYVNNGGPAYVPNSWQENALFISDGNANNWIAIEPIGVISNKSAVGTRLHIVTGDDRHVHRSVTVGKGFCNTDSPSQHFGLGPALRIKGVSIKWPSGIRQAYLDLRTATAYRIWESGFRWNGTPGVGATITIDAFGPPNGTVKLFHSAVPGETLDRVLGGIFHMGEPITWEAPFSLDSSGKATVSFTIPNDPNLSGKTLFLQAQVEDPAGIQPLTLTHKVDLVIP